ncbi:unnamed protein product [Ostreobium quekettii]|uniref:DNA-directed RNA polymerase subunit beta n=1 Tax=Ostreobium quekettii TaxID=121088 RepID=A0A8S1J1U6_9CHLO|nr:unnamed protein product [Ostreobium quekettii]
MLKNRIIIDFDSNGEVKATLASATHDRKSVTNVMFTKGRFNVKINLFSEEVNAAVVFKAMGVVSDQEIVQLVGHEGIIASHIAPTLHHAHELGIFTQQQALTYIGNRIRQSPKQQLKGWKRSKADEARDVLANVLLCHVPMKRFNFEHKVTFLGLTIRRMISAQLDPSLVDSKDYYGNKRLELAGNLLALLFEDLFKRLNWELMRQADSTLSKSNRAGMFDISRSIRQDVITHGFEHSLASGNWNIKRFKVERKGVSQVLSRLSFIAAFGMMTRVTSNVDKGLKLAGPRALHPAQWGMLCPADTPEGEGCGLTKNLALLTHVTNDDEEDPLTRLAYIFGVEPWGLIRGTDLARAGAIIVMLNGNVLGVHRRPRSFINAFRALRRAGRVGEFVSISIKHECILISCDGGRVCRPLIICDAGVPRVRQEHIEAVKAGKMDFNDFLRRGLIEYLDVNEENDCNIALDEKFCGPLTTHLEVEPFTILGVVAGLVPYPHHNQSPRNTYQCAMGKQAMGNIAFNQLKRMDTLLYLLCYPQRPLLTTQTIELVGFDRLGAGQNAVVAVMSYSGYDIEDAIVMNKAGLDRGFGRCIVLRKYGANVKRYMNRTMDQIRGPPLEAGGTGTALHRYRVLESDGLPAVGERIGQGDVFINKFVPRNTRDTLANPLSMGENFYKARAETFKCGPGEQYIVDRVLLTENEDSPICIKVLMRHTRVPELGDKFSSRHGQKGVVGNIVSQEDMPFGENGICPDLIMNPHGFPSRMTVGKMIELIGSKAAVLSGRFHSGTAFGEPTGLASSVAEISETLVAHGFNYCGKDFLTSGITGEPLQGYIFMGPVYYQKLKHMVLDKMHARARGPRMVLTRQPTEGRSRDGGLRLGEMERDCLIAYGASMLLLERLMISSDKFEVHVDTRSGLLGYYSASRGCAVSPLDKSSKHMASLTIPYACKLLFQELQGMNIVPRLRLTDL